MAIALVVSADGAAATAATAQPRGSNVSVPAEPGAKDRRIEQATDLIFDKRPVEAIALLDQVIQEYEAAHPPKRDTVYYSARSLTEALLYASLGMTQGAQAIVTDRNWADAYFLKGFALIDADRANEAIGWFDKALALSPKNAHMLAERAEWYKARHEWDRAYEEFDAARGATDFSEEDVVKAEKGRAIRGMAFVRVEQNRLDEAERLIRQALEIDPSDQKALSELQYIQSRH